MKINKFQKFITSFLTGLMLMNCVNGNNQNNLSKEATLALEKLATGGSVGSSDSTASNLSVNASRVDTSTYTRVYRLFNGRDHMASHIPGESGFGTEGSWYYYRNREPSSRALYRCLATWGDHFVSHDPNCEGQIKEGRLGYLLQKDPNDGRHVPLHRCMAGDHFVSQSSNCEGYTRGFVFGYAVAVDKVHSLPLTNVAMGKTATQSSLFHDGFASKAIDGNTDGHAGHGKSITHTNLDYQPWWMVDLGADYAVQGVTISNRTDCCAERLRDIRVSYLNSAGSVITSKDYKNVPEIVLLPANNVRKVKIQIIGRSEYLSLAEVQVWQKGQTTVSTGIPTIPNKHYFRIISAHSGKAIYNGGAHQNGQNIYQWTILRGAPVGGQLFSTVAKKDGYFLLKSYLSGKCLEVQPDGMFNNGATIQQSDCNGGKNQLFKAEGFGRFLRFKIKHSGKCLEVENFSTENGGDIHQWTCNDQLNQKWYIEPYTTYDAVDPYPRPHPSNVK
ncbi:MAG: RICIN domain-containing protein [Spirochaetota bacterium]